MPLAEIIGAELPAALPLWGVLTVAGILGILVTYAEPAIASLAPLGDLVDKRNTPYLFLVLSYQKEMVVFCIGLGVGVAAIVGTLRFLKNWSLKPIIYISVLLNMITSLYMTFGNPSLRPLVSFSWDCGAVTTGPVTVPILLALGVGVMKGKRTKAKAMNKIQHAVNDGETGSLEGFGIVTLASLFPVLTVQLLSIILSWVYSEDFIRGMSSNQTQNSWADVSPVKEVIFAVRSISPLIVFLVLVYKLCLKRQLPYTTVYLSPPATEQAKDGRVTVLDSPSVGSAEEVFYIAPEGDNSLRMRIEEDGSLKEVDSTVPDSQISPTVAGLLSETVELDEIPRSTVLSPVSTGSAEAGAETLGIKEVSKLQKTDSVERGFWEHHKYMFLGTILCLLGLTAFNIGLTYGFTSIANAAGNTLPAAFLELSYVSESPRYPFVGGVAIVQIVIFALGILATRAEPALNVLGKTVESLSKGQFSAKMLVFSVCIGVGLGIRSDRRKYCFLLLLLLSYS